MSDNLMRWILCKCTTLEGSGHGASQTSDERCKLILETLETQQREQGRDPAAVDIGDFLVKSSLMPTNMTKEFLQTLLNQKSADEVRIAAGQSLAALDSDMTLLYCSLRPDTWTRPAYNYLFAEARKWRKSSLTRLALERRIFMIL